MQSDQPTSNILELPDPDAFNCIVKQYSIGHSEMTIKLIHSITRNQKFFVEFAHVCCFSGPVFWKGAALRKGQQDEYLQFMREAMPVQQLTEDELLDTARFGDLYIFDAEGCQVKIVAVGVTKFDSSHPRYAP